MSCSATHSTQEAGGFRFGGATITNGRRFDRGELAAGPADQPSLSTFRFALNRVDGSAFASEREARGEHSPAPGLNFGWHSAGWPAGTTDRAEPPVHFSASATSFGRHRNPHDGPCGSSREPASRAYTPRRGRLGLYLRELNGLTEREGSRGETGGERYRDPAGEASRALDPSGLQVTARAARPGDGFRLRVGAERKVGPKIRSTIERDSELHIPARSIPG